MILAETLLIDGYEQALHTEVHDDFNYYTESILSDVTERGLGFLVISIRQVYTVTGIEYVLAETPRYKRFIKNIFQVLLATLRGIGFLVISVQQTYAMTGMWDTFSRRRQDKKSATVLFFDFR